MRGNHSNHQLLMTCTFIPPNIKIWYIKKYKSDYVSGWYLIFVNVETFSNIKNNDVIISIVSTVVSSNKNYIPNNSTSYINNNLYIYL